MAQVATNRIFPFFVSCGRSGSTLLRSMFDSHPSIAIPGESYFITELLPNRKLYEAAAPFRDRRLANVERLGDVATLGPGRAPQDDPRAQPELLASGRASGMTTELFEFLVGENELGLRPPDRFLLHARSNRTSEREFPQSTSFYAEPWLRTLAGRGRTRARA